MGIEYVHFDINGEEGVLTYKNAQGVKKLPFGFGYNVFSKFPEENYSDLTATIPEPGNMYDCAVSADWPEEQKLRIKVQIIDKYFGNMSMEFGFKEDKVGIFMTKTAEAFLEEYYGYANGSCVVEEYKKFGKEKTKKAKNGIDARNICDIISFVYWRLAKIK